MTKLMLINAFTLFCFGISTMALAEQDDGSRPMMNHTANMAMTNPVISGPTEGGQSAFAAIQEIVNLLIENPDTNWKNINIEILRRHLIDMDNVTLRSEVSTENIDGGARFFVTSNDPSVAESIRRMVLAHAATTESSANWVLSAEPNDYGASLTAIGDPVRVRALGFIGIMTVGAHHQAHHLALAQGRMPH